VLSPIDHALYKKDADVVLRHADRVPYLCVVVRKEKIL